MGETDGGQDTQLEAWDDVSQERLDMKLVRKAREDEMQFNAKTGLYKYSSRGTAKEVTNKPSIKVRWVDTNKGDSKLPNYRSRLVAKEIRTHRDDNLYAATPPLESLRVLLSMAASGPGRTGKALKIMIMDLTQ